MCRSVRDFAARRDMGYRSAAHPILRPAAPASLRSADRDCIPCWGRLRCGYTVCPAIDDRHGGADFGA